MKLPTPRRVFRAVRKGAALPPLELLALAPSAALFALAELSLRFRPLAWSATKFGARLETTCPAGELPVLSDRDLRAIRAVRRLSPRIYGTERGCLRRSLVLAHHLRRHDPVMRIGVGRDDQGAFSAHAWLELNGHPIESPGEHLAFEVPRSHP